MAARSSWTRSATFRLPLQVKLLRFLQERVIERIGGRKPIAVDTRIVCATHQNLEAMIAAGSFREDLYYRLAEIVVRIPSLAERPGDAALLAKHFLARFAREMNPQIKGFAAGALDAIESWRWPGNIRELENRMKRAVIMADGKLISAEDLDLAAPVEEALAVNLKAAREAADRWRNPQGPGQGRQQYLECGEAARDQPADALRSDEAIWVAAVRWLAVPLAAVLLASCSAGGTAYERGLAAFEAGDMRTARVELLNALQGNPDDGAARLLRARVELALGDGVAAEAEIARARQSGVAVAETRHLFAHARLLQGDARGALAEAGQAPPAFAGYAARIRARAFAALGDGAAGAEFDRAARLAPQDSATFVDIARFRRDRGDLAGALQAVDRAVALGPHNAEAMQLRGEMTRSQYGLAAALPWFDRALEIDPGSLNARLERAMTYGELGRMTDMLADAREAHRLNGGASNMAFYMQAVLAARARDFELARAIYNRTNGVFAERPAGMLLESAIDFGMGNVEQAAGRLTGSSRCSPATARRDGCSPRRSTGWIISRRSPTLWRRSSRGPTPTATASL